jgi:bifunctional non-homologous end joining protein LigD
MPIALMLAALTDRRDFGDDWLLERKFDGERCVARKDGGEVRLESRTAKDLTGTYPEVRAAVASQRDRSILLDGEAVAFDGAQTSFSRLQQRLGVTNPSQELVAAYPVVFCVFDLLEVDGDDLRGRPLLERRARLSSAIRPSAALQLSEAWRDDSQRRFEQACRAGWEGLIAKRAQAPYVPGPLAGLAEAEVRLGAGVRDRRLHRSRRKPNGLRRAARGLLRRPRTQIRR